MLKLIICYAIAFICVFLCASQHINIIKYEHDDTAAANYETTEEEYTSEQTEPTEPTTQPESTEPTEPTEIPETTKTTEIPDLPTEPETEKPTIKETEPEPKTEPTTLSDPDDFPAPTESETVKETEIEFEKIENTEDIENVEDYDPEQLREILISATGDLTLASNYKKPYANSFYELYDLYGPGYFCENVAHIFEASDCVIANLECALTDSGARQSDLYAYRGYKKYTDILTASYIDVVNRANNHSHDYSQSGYDDTSDALNSAGIDYYGYDTVLIKEINGIKVGFTGSVGTYDLAGVKRRLDYLTQNGAEIKIVSFHWGIMDQRVADQSQVTAARCAIDNGADLVIGHHPHVLQGIEIYKGKYIAYSLGNFIFDGNVISDIENRTSIIFQIKFVLQGSEIADSEITLIPILTTSNMSRNNFKPMLADGAQKDAILQKIEARSAYHR